MIPCNKEQQSWGELFYGGPSNYGHIGYPVSVRLYLEEDEERGATMNVRIVVSVTEIADMNPKDRYVVGGIGEFMFSVSGHFHGLFVFLMRQPLKDGRLTHVLLFACASVAPTPSFMSSSLFPFLFFSSSVSAALFSLFAIRYQGPFVGRVLANMWDIFTRLIVGIRMKRRGLL